MQIGAMIDCAIVGAGHADLVAQEVAVMVQAGFAAEVAKLARQNLLMNNKVPLVHLDAHAVPGAHPC